MFFKTVLERRERGWGPDVALVGVWTDSYPSDMYCILADSYLPTLLHIPISNLYFLFGFSTNAYL